MGKFDLSTFTFQQSSAFFARVILF